MVCGFAFKSGSFQAIEMGKGLRDFTVSPAPSGSLDASLAATGIPIFALDPRLAPRGDPAAAGFWEPQATRSIGSAYSEDSAAKYWSTLKQTDHFDVLLFVEKTTAARKNPLLSP